MRVEYGDQLKPFDETDATHFITNRTETTPAKAYRRGIEGWVLITSQQTTNDFVQYSGIDLVNTFNENLK